MLECRYCKHSVPAIARRIATPLETAAFNASRMFLLLVTSYRMMAGPFTIRWL
jgi:hypothetical protein